MSGNPENHTKNKRRRMGEAADQPTAAIQEADAVTLTAGRHGGDLARWLADQGFAGDEGPGAIADVPRVRTLLLRAAREGRAMSYSEVLGALEHRFTRPKMRALCCTLDTIDQAGRAAGEPGLAVLVVRESDGLPGQGWWMGWAKRLGYAGAWTGPEATAIVRACQEQVFAYWTVRVPMC